MPAITAAQILDETSYTESDISATNLEYLIDNAIDYVNLEAGTSISSLSGSPGSVTVTNAQSVAVKALAKLMLRAYVDHGPYANVAAVGVSFVANDPQLKLEWKLINRALQRLRGRSFERT